MGTHYTINSTKKATQMKASSKSKPVYSYPKYIQVVALSAERAKAFLDTTDSPVDLGPAPGRPGNHIWGFSVTGKTFVKTSPNPH